MISEVPQGGRHIWTGVYRDVEGVAVGEDFLQLFTVADSEAQAEGAFEYYIGGLQDSGYDIGASERTTRLSLLPGETVLHAVTRLHELGYRFVFPMRDAIEDEEIAGLVSRLLRILEE